jgi:phosphatidate cytidylyltransferase
VSEAAGHGPSELTKRVLSGIVMGVAAIGVTWWGGWPFAVMWTVIALIVGWEWLRIVDVTPLAEQAAPVGWIRRHARESYLGAPGLALSGVAAGAFTGLWLLGPMFIAGAILVAYFGAPRERGVWAAVGIAYVLPLGVGAILCRDGVSIAGMIVIFWLFAVVWGTDIIAYFTGRSLGGPKLWPAVSPKKTWSGAIGGLIGGTALGCALLVAFGVQPAWPHLALSVAFSILTQLGDLFESAMKRRFGVKDSGSLIPGHGGFMDRLDGFIFAVAFAAGFGALRGGPLQVPSGLLVWP